MNTYKNAPYYDDYNPDKEYTQLLALPGRAEQAREFTQIQSIQRDFLGRLGDSLYKEGTIIDGCTLIITDKTAIISSGRIYLNGLIRIVDGATLNIDGVGSESIGVKIITSIITETEDISFRDPAQGYENYGQGGAHRLKEHVEFTINDPESSVIYNLEDGNLASDSPIGEGSQITDTLARRTYDENGNYKINGLELRDRNETSENKILISMSEGKAYIRGYEINKDISTTIKLNYSTSLREIRNEVRTYNNSNNLYRLTNQPVKEITEVNALVTTTVQLTKGGYGGRDYIGLNNVSEIVEVYELVSGLKNVYRSGDDYIYQGDDQIDWSPRMAGESREPESGRTYYCTVIYSLNMQLGKDIDLITDEESGFQYLKFLSGGARPNNNDRFRISYKFYLARKDLVCLNKKGEIVIIEGEPNTANLAESKLNQNEDNLPLGTVLIMPNSSKIHIVNHDTIRLSQLDLYNVRKRVTELEYNQAMTDLDKEAEEGENATNLKGIFTDGFIGLTKCDTGHPEFNCTIDLDNNELTLPINTSVINATPNYRDIDTNIATIGKFITAPYNHKLAKQQIYATQSLLVNPYAVYDPLSIVGLNPSMDTWIDSSMITVEKESVTTTTLRRWWYHKGASWAESEKAKWQALGFSDGGESLGWNSGGVANVSVDYNTILDEAIMYMRRITVEVVGSNFTPNIDNIRCYFNDTLVPLTSKVGLPGTQPGTVKADAQGVVNATFKVPANVPCGTVEVRLESPTGKGVTNYTSNGRRRITQKTILTTRTEVKPSDPLAQSFQFETDTILTKACLYFASKDPNRSIIIQIRDMVNGYPGSTIYTEKEVRAEDVKVSADSTIATEILFEDPVYCFADTQYCIVVISDSDVYSMYVAELGKNDEYRHTIVSRQPYTDGVLFTSSNGLTWSAHQTMDLKFDLYKAEYTGDGVVIFNDIDNTIMNQLLIAAEYIDYKNAGINWYYRVNPNKITSEISEKSWLPIETYVDQDLGVEAKYIQLKAVIKINYSTSPIIAGDCINLIGFLTQNTGSYISREVSTSEKFTNIRVIFDADIPSVASVKVYIFTDQESTWKELTTPISVTPVNEEFSTYEYNHRLSQPGGSKYRIKIEMSSNNILIRPRIKKLKNILKY